MSSKLEQEIEEILARTGGPPPPARFRPRGSSLGQAMGNAASSVGSLLAGINAGQLMLASILLIIGSWFVLRQWETAMTIVALTGLALFVIAFVLAIARRRTRGSGPPETRYWRGQPMDYDSQPQGSFRNPFRNLFRRR
jgi:VIT1/CCC1 family predicted Fe2+/Mn2+ transporter